MDGRAASLARLTAVASAAFLVALPALAQEATSPTGVPSAAAAAAAAPKRPAPPEPVRALEVVVRDPAGQPVAGAVVVATPSSGAWLPFGGVARDTVRATVTGASGRALLEALPPGPWTLVVQAEGFAPRRVRRVEAGPLEVRLEMGGVLTGVVRDAEGSPVAGARVALDADLPLETDWVAEASRVEAVTDGEGRFRLGGIGPTPVRVVARAPGFGRAEREGLEAGGHVELFLFPGATLVGTIVDGEGRAVEGALVQAAGGGLGTTAPPSERTDKEGTFVMAGVEPGEYVVVAREAGRAPGIGRAVVEADAEANVEIVLTAGGFVTGRLVDPEGEPLAGRAETVAFEGLGLPGFASELMSAEARGDGRFALGPLPPGGLEIRATAAGHAAKRVQALVPEAGATVDLGSVALDAGLAIRGRVTDVDGVGIGGARVTATAESAAPYSPFEATSDADGGFAARGLEDDAYELVASAPGFARASATARAGDQDVELRLEAAGEIGGRVVDADGRPVAEARVRAEPADASSRPRGRVLGSVEDEEGRFLLRDVAAGSWILRAETRGRGEASRPGVRVVAGRTTDAGTLVLDRGGVIRGTVVDTDGSGIPGATVQAERDLRSRGGRLQARSESGGRFELPGVPPGRFAVFASHPAFASSEPVVAEVEPEAEPEAVRLVLPRGGRIEGQAFHRDGRAFLEGRIMTSGLGPALRGAGSDAPIGDDGWFSIDHLPPGRTQVNLMAWTPSSPMVSGPSANILTGVASRDVEVRDDETATVDFRVRDVVVSGQVTRGDRPVPGVRVSVMGEISSAFTFVGPATPGTAAIRSGPPPLTATTREDGRYELVVYSPGRSHVEMQELAGGRVFPGRDVEVPDVELFTLDLELAEAAVSGVLVDAESGQPVEDGGVQLHGAEPGGTWAGGGPAGRDGTFTIPVEPGEYRLTARAPRRKPETVDVSVGPAGVDGLRIEMEHGLLVRGRLVDAHDRPAAGLSVFASDPESGGRVGYARSLADGAFLLDGLEDKPYTFAAGTELAGFAIRTGVTPGDEPLTLRLSPAGRVAVRVLDAAGRPVKDAYPHVRVVEGAPTYLPGLRSAPTNEAGVAELPAPAGTVGVEVRQGSSVGRGSVTVEPGQTAPLDVVLAPAGDSP